MEDADGWMHDTTGLDTLRRLQVWQEVLDEASVPGADSSAHEVELRRHLLHAIKFPGNK
jgi:hypothetical protein